MKPNRFDTHVLLSETYFLPRSACCLFSRFVLSCINFIALENYYNASEIQRSMFINIKSEGKRRRRC